MKKKKNDDADPVVPYWNLGGIFCNGFLLVFGLASEFVEQARGMAGRGDITKAIGMLDKAVQADSKNTSALILRGWARERQDDQDLAVGDYAAAIEADQNCGTAWEMRGRRLVYRIMRVLCVT